MPDKDIFGMMPVTISGTLAAPITLSNIIWQQNHFVLKGGHA